MPPENAPAASKAHPQDGGLPLKDAPAGNWVDHHAPMRMKPWLRLIRADRPIGVWLLLWPCWWSLALAGRDADDALPNLQFMVLFAVGAFVMRSAGCIYNDILDRDIDAKVERTKARPLASGAISLRGAVILMLLLCLCGLAVLLQFNPFAVALGFVSVGIVMIYPLMKRITYWPQAVLGLAFSWGALMGWAAYYGEISAPPLALYIASVAWTIGYDTIYAHQDKEDDAVIGLKSTALKFGDKTKPWLIIFYGVTLAGLAMAGILVGAQIFYFAGLTAAAAHLAWQVGTLNTDSAANCLERFRSNHGFGALIFLSMAADMIISS
jgi:4-hydroxybenzoate polyprenyltransferase